MLTNPGSQIVLGHKTGRDGENCSQDGIIARLEVVAINTKERDDCEESDAFVSVQVWVVRNQRKAVGSGKLGEIANATVSPLIPRPSESRLKQVFVANPEQTAVLTDLVRLNGIKG